MNHVVKYDCLMSTELWIHMKQRALSPIACQQLVEYHTCGQLLVYYTFSPCCEIGHTSYRNHVFDVIAPKAGSFRISCKPAYQQNAL